MFDESVTISYESREATCTWRKWRAVHRRCVGNIPAHGIVAIAAKIAMNFGVKSYAHNMHNYRCRHQLYHQETSGAHCV